MKNWTQSHCGFVWFRFRPAMIIANKFISNRLLIQLVVFHPAHWITLGIYRPLIFSLAATALKLQQIPMFLHISARFGGHRWYPQISEPCVKTAITFQWKCLCVPDCKYIESMFINFIQMSLYNISPMQAILYQFKRDMPLPTVRAANVPYTSVIRGSVHRDLWRHIGVSVLEVTTVMNALTHQNDVIKYTATSFKELSGSPYSPLPINRRNSWWQSPQIRVLSFVSGNCSGGTSAHAPATGHR